MKYEIEIEGLPEGWELTRLKLPDNCIEKTNSCTISINNRTGAVFSLKKLKPRRIVLEETTELMGAEFTWLDSVITDNDKTVRFGVQSKYVWKEIKEE